MSKLLKKKQLNKKIKNFTINLGLNGSKRSFSAKSTKTLINYSFCHVCQCIKGPSSIYNSEKCAKRNFIFKKKKKQIVAESGLHPKIKDSFTLLGYVTTFGLAVETLRLEKGKFENIKEQQRISNEFERIRLNLASECKNDKNSLIKQVENLQKDQNIIINNNKTKIDNVEVLGFYLFIYLLGFKMLFFYILTLYLPLVSFTIIILFTIEYIFKYILY